MNIVRPRTILAVVASTVMFAVSQGAVATDAPAQREIDHLLEFVGTSPCVFVRNGTEYPADKAREHLASKYQFAGGRIATAEDFIKYLATQSSVSGERYHVKCGKTDALSGAWLTEELMRFRKTSSPPLQARR